MSPLYSDTHPKMEEMQLEVLRRMPVWKKLSVLNGLNETVRILAIAGIRARNPDAAPEQIQRDLADLILGKELAQKVYDHAR